MSFITTYFRKKPKDVSKKDVEDFLARKVEENLNLDYKAIKAYEDFDELSKDVAAFANSDGGLIVLGISQNEIKSKKSGVKVQPKEITWGEESLSKERLEDNLVGKIRPRIDGLVIQPVREGNGSLKVIFLIDIPKSNNSPHMSADRRYHKRLNFRRTLMEHSEIVDKLKVRWVLKEKIIDKIYEPLASILEQNANQLSKYNAPQTYGIEEILSKTYYAWQIPDELKEYIDNYISLLKDLNIKEYFARNEMNDIISRNIFSYLKLDSGIVSNRVNINFQLKYVNSTASLTIQKLYELLLTNQTIQDYLNESVFSEKCETIGIQHNSQWNYVNLEVFDEEIWKKCLKETRENQTVMDFIKGADGLWEDAISLTSDIISVY